MLLKWHGGSPLSQMNEMQKTSESVGIAEILDTQAAQSAGLCDRKVSKQGSKENFPLPKLLFCNQKDISQQGCPTQRLKADVPLHTQNISPSAVAFTDCLSGAGSGKFVWNSVRRETDRRTGRGLSETRQAQS